MSQRSSTGLPSICSGAMYCSVPAMELAPISVELVHAAVGSAAQPLREAEVEHLRAVGVSITLAGFEVAMDDPLAMDVAERVGDVARDVDRLVDRERSARQPAGQRFAFEILHHEEIESAVVPDVVDAADVRVLEPRDRLRLAVEPLAHLVGSPVAARDDLDRDRCDRAADRARDTPRPCRPVPSGATISYGPRRAPGASVMVALSGQRCAQPPRGTRAPSGCSALRVGELPVDVALLVASDGRRSARHDARTPPRPRHGRRASPRRAAALSPRVRGGPSRCSLIRPARRAAWPGRRLRRADSAYRASDGAGARPGRDEQKRPNLGAVRVGVHKTAITACSSSSNPPRSRCRSRSDRAAARGNGEQRFPRGCARSSRRARTRAHLAPARRMIRVVYVAPREQLEVLGLSCSPQTRFEPLDGHRDEAPSPGAQQRLVGRRRGLGGERSHPAAAVGPDVGLAPSAPRAGIRRPGNCGSPASDTDGTGPCADRRASKRRPDRTTVSKNRCARSSASSGRRAPRRR